MRVEPERKVAYVGDPVVITCISRGEVTWTRDGKGLPSQFLRIHNQVTILAASLSDTGSYVCLCGRHFATAKLFVGGEL